jgi:25S rRNA (cytosine2870-C5)-methyltransferase
VVSKDASVKTNRTERDFVVLPERQKRLLIAAIDSANATAVVVYSTCSVTVEENEQVVDYALARRPNVRLVPTGLDFGKPGFARFRGKVFHPSLKETRRFYPHAHNLDGFFVAKLQKFAPSKPTAAANGTDKEAAVDVAEGDTTFAAESRSKDGPGGAGARAGVGAGMEAEADSDFGGWNDTEDDALIRRALKARARRRGIDPRVVVRGRAAKD